MAKDKGRTKAKKPASVKDLPERGVTATRAKAGKGGQATRRQVQGSLTRSPGFQTLPPEQQKKIAHDM